MVLVYGSACMTGFPIRKHLQTIFGLIYSLPIGNQYGLFSSLCFCFSFQQTNTHTNKIYTHTHTHTHTHTQIKQSIDNYYDWHICRCWRGLCFITKIFSTHDTNNLHSDFYRALPLYACYLFNKVLEFSFFIYFLFFLFFYFFRFYNQTTYKPNQKIKKRKQKYKTKKIYGITCVFTTN